VAQKETKTTYTKPEVWAERYKLASGQQNKLFKRFSNWYDSLYTVVGTQAAPWRSKVYVPMLARQTWALVSKFLALKPGFQVRVASPIPADKDDQHPDQDDNEQEGVNDVDEQAEKARRKLEFDYENPYLDNTMRDKLFAPLLDAVVCGTGLAKVTWCVDEVTTYKRNVENGIADLTKQEKTTKKRTYNNLEPVNIFNVFVSPSATDLYNAPWIIIKEYKTMAELEKAGIYKNLDKLKNSSEYDDEFQAYNASRNRLISSQSRNDKTITNICIYECYEGNTISTYAQSTDSNEAWVTLLQRENPYWHGKYPLVKFHVKKRPYDFWGEGIFETTYRLQAAYNDVYNHFLDQWNLAENSMLMMRENSNVNDYIVEPGGTITYRGDQPPTQFKHAMPDPRALQTILTYIDQAVEGVTISQYAAGMPNSATDNTKGTATGIMKLQEAAGDLISFMRQNFAQSITQIGRMWLSNNQQYLDQPVNIVVTAQGKKQPMTIRPEDMQGEMELIIDDSTMDPSSQDDKINRFMAFSQTLEQYQQASMQQAQANRWTTSPLYIDYAQVLQDASDVMDRTQFDKYLLDSQKVEQAMQASQTPMIMPHEQFKLDLNQLYGSEASQLLQRNGIQPDPQRAQQQNPVMQDAFVAGQTGIDGQSFSDPRLVTPDHAISAAQAASQQELDQSKLGLQAQAQAHKQSLAEQAHQQQLQINAAKAQHDMMMKQEQVKQQGMVARMAAKVRGNNGRDTKKKA
jgi:hypothetical protein